MQEAGLQEAFAILYNNSITVKSVDSWKGLKKGGTRGEGKQCRIGDAYDQGIKGMEFLPQYLSLKVGAYGQIYELLQWNTEKLKFPT